MSTEITENLLVQFESTIPSPIKQPASEEHQEKQDNHAFETSPVLLPKRESIPTAKGEWGVRCAKNKRSQGCFSVNSKVKKYADLFPYLAGKLRRTRAENF